MTLEPRSTQLSSNPPNPVVAEQAIDSIAHQTVRLQGPFTVSQRRDLAAISTALLRLAEGERL